MIKKLTLIIVLISGLIACSQNVYNEKLMEAIANNDIKQVSSILKKQKANIDINHISNSETPLTLALNYSNWSYSIDRIVELLVENGADVNAKNENGETALMIASEKGNLELVMYLVENGADINSENEDGETALMIASEKGNLELVMYLVENGADINSENEDGETALMRALRYDDIEIVKYMAKCLIEKGADINAKDNYGWTSLMHASSNGDLEVVKYLVENGADVNAKDNYDITALMRASGNGNLSMVIYLVENGADINSEDEDGETALMRALRYDDIEIAKYMAKYLIEKGADINAKDNYGETSLMEVTYRHGEKLWHGNGKELVDFLIKNKANVNAKDNYGRTALMYAFVYSIIGEESEIEESEIEESEIEESEIEESEIEEELERMRCNSEDYYQDGGLQLSRYMHISMLNTLFPVDPDILDVVKLLIKAGANVNEVNNYGDSALLYAISMYKYSISLYRHIEHSDTRKFELIDYALPIFETIKLLIDNGANVNIKDKDGETPLSLAAGFPELIELLKDNGAHY